LNPLMFFYRDPGRFVKEKKQEEDPYPGCKKSRPKVTSFIRLMIRVGLNAVVLVSPYGDSVHG
jgi:hypothetical protein